MFARATPAAEPGLAPGPLHAPQAHPAATLEDGSSGPRPCSAAVPSPGPGGRQAALQGSASAACSSMQPSEPQRMRRSSSPTSTAAGLPGACPGTLQGAWGRAASAASSSTPPGWLPWVLRRIASASAGAPGAAQGSPAYSGPAQMPERLACPGNPSMRARAASAAGSGAQPGRMQRLMRRAASACAAPAELTPVGCSALAAAQVAEPPACQTQPEMRARALSSAGGSAQPSCMQRVRERDAPASAAAPEVASPERRSESRPGWQTGLPQPQSSLAVSARRRSMDSAAGQAYAVGHAVPRRGSLAGLGWTRSQPAAAAASSSLTELRENPLFEASVPPVCAAAGRAEHLRDRQRVDSGVCSPAPAHLPPSRSPGARRSDVPGAPGEELFADGSFSSLFRNPTFEASAAPGSPVVGCGEGLCNVCSPGIHTCASPAEGSAGPGDGIRDGIVQSTAAVLACPQATLILAMAGCAYGASALTPSGMPQVQRHALARKSSADGHTLVAAECGEASYREGDWELPGQQMAGSCPDPDLGQAGVADEPGGQQHHLSAAHMGVGSAASSAACSDNELGVGAATVFLWLSMMSGSVRR